MADHHTTEILGGTVLLLPIAWILENFSPTEAPYDDLTWAGTLALFEVSHTHLDALREDLAAHGIRTPVELHPDGRVLRGHHRLLLGAQVGLVWTPAVFAHRGGPLLFPVIVA